MSGGYLPGFIRRRAEERLAEVRQRLTVGDSCARSTGGGAANAPGFLEAEEELLYEAAELERILAAREACPPQDWA